MNYQAIIDKYYPEENELKHILLVHSRSVADKALMVLNAIQSYILIVNSWKKLPCYMILGSFVVMLQASNVLVLNLIYVMVDWGAEMLRKEGFPRHARVCERHTGAGVTREQIINQHLPLPEQDFCQRQWKRK